LAKKDIPDAIEALKMIGSAMDQLQHSLGTCTQVKDDVAKLKVMVERFKHPKEELAHIIEDIKKHNLKILQAISLAREDLHLLKYEAAGVDIGQVVAMTALGAEQPIKYNNTEMAMVMQGVLNAYGAKMSLEDVMVCLATEGEAAHMVEKNVILLKKALAEKNFSDIAGDSLNIFLGIKMAEGAIPICSGTCPTDSWDYKGLVSDTEKVSSSIKATDKDVLINGFSIVQDMIKAEHHYEDGVWVAFGKDLGDILKLVSKKSLTLQSLAAPKLGTGPTNAELAISA